MKMLMTAGLLGVVWLLLFYGWKPQTRDDRDAKAGMVAVLGLIVMVLALLGIWLGDW